MKRSNEPVWAHDDRPLRELIVILLDPLEIFARRICLANCPRSQVHDLIPVSCNIGVQLGHTRMCPVSPDHGENVTQTIRPDVKTSQ